MIIGISGKKNSGKDTVGRIIQLFFAKYSEEDIIDILEKKHSIYEILPFIDETNWQIKKFATIPTEIYKKITNIDFHSLSRTEKELERPNFIDFINNKVKQVFGKDVWVKALMREYFCTHSDHALNGIDCPNWIITDVRFINEAEAILNKESILIRVNREFPVNTDDLKPYDFEESETELDNFDKFNYVIDNNDSLENLIVKVKEILIKEKLI